SSSPKAIPCSMVCTSSIPSRNPEIRHEHPRGIGSHPREGAEHRRIGADHAPYTIEHEPSGQWAVGEGVYNHAAKTLARTIVYDTSNGNTSLVNFANGIVDVWIDLPAEKAVMLDADSGNLTVPAGNTMALTGATVSGAPTWSSNQAITLSTAIQPNVTTMAALASVG